MDMTKKEKWSFAIAGAGQNMVNTLVTMFVVTYMTAGVSKGGPNLSQAGVVAFGLFMTLEKIWDAVNDTIMGVLVDKTHTKYGKLRPYILITALPICLLTILMFNSHLFNSDVAILVFFGIIYVIWESFYTLCDVPYWGLAARITNVQDERTKVIALTRIVQAVGAAIAFGIGTYGPELLGGKGLGTRTQIGYSISAIIISVIGMGLFTLAFFNTKEKNDDADNEKIKIKDVVVTAVKCKPLYINLIGSFVAFGRSMITVVGGTFLVNIIGNTDLSLFVIIVMMAGSVVANFYTPILISKIGTRNLMISSSLVTAAIYIALYFVGYTNTIIFLLIVFILGLLGGMILLAQTEMIAEAVDDIRNKEGKNREGVCFSGLTFSGKITNALATLAFTIILILVAGTSTTEGIKVTSELTSALWMGLTILPAISSVLSTIVYYFYPIKKPFTFK